MDKQIGNVLVVDDSRMNRIKLGTSLKRQGHTVTQAEDGGRALELLRENAFDLVVLDIMMPVLNGYQVLETMKADPELRDIPVIVISALDEMDSVVRCIEMGAEDYLPRSYDPVLLRARIGACLEKKRLRDAIAQQLGRYVPESVVRAIVAGEGTLETVQTVATILYCDIESFTSIAESMPPKQVVAMLNEYFPAVIEPITENQGVVNQFQGDAMLVTFNVPIQVPRHADRAVQAARGILEVVRGRTFAGASLNARIGINTGQVVAGNVGTGNRVNYTVHGDAVNLAARLEQLNKDYGTRLLISHSSVALLQESPPIEPIGAVAIRGKAEPVEIYGLRL
jgi:class 3 adenylate cyclase